jgi:hypothetical protein
MSSSGSEAAIPLAEPKKLTFGTRVAKGSRSSGSIRADTMMLILSFTPSASRSNRSDERCGRGEQPLSRDDG